MGHGYDLLCLTIICCLDFVLLQENIALKQATFQQGTYKDGFSSRAVDGDRNPVYADDSCTHTATVTQPWWAVDLRWSRQIAVVTITNRAQMSGRLANLTIGLTDDHPDVTRPYPSNIRICHYQEPSLASRETASFPCVETGRYLVVMLDVTINQILTLCEVEVYEDASALTMEPPTVAPREELPYNYRPSHEHPMTLCYLKALSPEEQQTARDCFRECFVNVCCKAVNITSCEQSYVKSEYFHYVKEGLSTEPREECSCAQPETGGFGGTEGTPFSFYSVYEETDSAIRNVSVFHEADEGIKGIFLEYEGRYVAGVAGEGYRGRTQFDCLLGPDERITDVTVYVAVTVSVTVVHGIRFVTSEKDCGTFGATTADSLHVAGHQLLFMSGTVKDQITSLTMHFDYDCNTL